MPAQPFIFTVKPWSWLTDAAYQQGTVVLSSADIYTQG